MSLKKITITFVFSVIFSCSAFAQFGAWMIRYTEEEIRFYSSMSNLKSYIETIKDSPEGCHTLSYQTGTPEDPEYQFVIINNKTELCISVRTAIKIKYYENTIKYFMDDKKYLKMAGLKWAKEGMIYEIVESKMPGFFYVDVKRSSF